MKADLMLSQLLSIRATVEALIVEVEEGRRIVGCCAQPRLITTETYNGSEVRCGNCGKDISAPSGPQPEGG